MRAEAVTVSALCSACAQGRRWRQGLALLGAARARRASRKNDERMAGVLTKVEGFTRRSPQ